MNAHGVRRVLMSSRYLLIPAVAALAACSSQSTTPDYTLNPGGDGSLAIQTVKAEYTWEEVSGQTGVATTATLVNQSDRTFYARLGAAFDDNPLQPLLWVAEGGDGFVEHQVSPLSWELKERHPLIEGVSVVPLRPHTTYTLTFHVREPKAAGDFRLKVQYFDRREIQPEDEAHVDVSNTFAIR